MESERTYIAIDLKSFYASVECRERGLDPLTAKLVVADKSRTDKTICLAVSPALKAYGLSGRCRLFEVERKVREVKRQRGEDLEYIAAVPRMALYIKYSARIYAVYLRHFAPEDIHVYSIDEVFIDATSYLKLYKIGARELAVKVIRDILSETGITATAGIGPNLYLCKIAMDIVAKHVGADKDGVRVAELDQMEYRKKLWDHKPLTDFWRIGNGTARRLEKYFVRTMGDVARLSLKNSRLLYDEFGIDAEILIDHAWGYEPVGMKEIKGYKSAAKSLGSGQVLHCPYDFEKAKIVVREMADSLAMSLYEKKLATSSVALDCFYDVKSLSLDSFDGEIVRDYYGRLAPKPAHGTIAVGQDTNSAKAIIDGFMALFERIGNKNYLYRKISVCAVDVIPLEKREATLFDGSKEAEREESLQRARIGIVKKFGKNAILKCSSYEEGATMKERNLQIGGHRA